MRCVGVEAEGHHHGHEGSGKGGLGKHGVRLLLRVWLPAVRVTRIAASLMLEL